MLHFTLRMFISVELICCCRGGNNTEQLSQSNLSSDGFCLLLCEAAT